MSCVQVGVQGRAGRGFAAILNVEARDRRRTLLQAPRRQGSLSERLWLSNIIVTPDTTGYRGGVESAGYLRLQEVLHRWTAVSRARTQTLLSKPVGLCLRGRESIKGEQGRCPIERRSIAQCKFEPPKYGSNGVQGQARGLIQHEWHVWDGGRGWRHGRQ